MQAWRPQCDPQNWSTVEGGKNTGHKEVVLWPQLIPPVLSLLHPPSQYCTHTIIHKTFKVFVGWHVLQTVLLMISSEAVLQRAVCPVTPVPSHCGWSFVKVWTSVYCSSSAEKASSAPAAHRMTPVNHGFRELNSQRCSCSLCTKSPSAAANLFLLFIYAMSKVKSNVIVTF